MKNRLALSPARLLAGMATALTKGCFVKSKIPLVAGLLLLAGWSPAWAAPADLPLAAADNAFAFKLLKQLGQDQPARNILISPYSAATVLQMVASGAAGQTRTEMQQVLGTTGLSADVVMSVRTGNR